VESCNVTAECRAFTPDLRQPAFFASTNGPGKGELLPKSKEALLRTVVRAVPLNSSQGKAVATRIQVYCFQCYENIIVHSFFEH
jgi:hypothetical protein